MRTILFLLEKEFKQIFRNKQLLPMIFVMPVVQLLILVNAATFDINHINTHIVDHDKSSASRKLINGFISSSYFRIAGSSNSEADGIKQIEHNEARLIIEIPVGFERNIMNNTSTEIGFIINAEDGAAAGVIQSYIVRILSAFNESSIQINRMRRAPIIPSIQLIEMYRFNPTMDYKMFMIPGILGILVTLIGLFLASINIVKEKEIGTIEQINVTPIKKSHFIIGKLLPFWIIAIFELAFGLLVAWLIYRVNIEGDILIIFLMASIYLIIILSGGLLISTISNTQQQALFTTFFFNILLILLSGLFTPIESMPQWAQILAFFDPFSHFVEIMRRVMIKGAGIAEIADKALVIAIFAIGMVILAISRYSKRA